MSKFAKIFSIVFLIALLGFGGYVVLDAMVIPHRMAVVSATDDTENSDSSSSAGNSEVADNTVAPADSDINDAADSTDAESDTSYFTDGEVITTDNSYTDANVAITITNYREYDTDIYVADIRVSDISHFCTMFAQNSYGLNITEKTSQMASDSGAILAINGDFYGKRESGYVIRDGVLYRDTVYRDGNTGKANSALVLYEDGSMDSVIEGEVSAQSLLEDGALDVWSFGPALIKNNEIAVDKNEEVGKAMASNPRTAIVCMEPLHYLFIVSDGRTDESAGLSLYQLANFIEDNFDAPFAFNMDGGGSSTMVFNGNIINKPVASGSEIGERYVSDSVYIK